MPLSCLRNANLLGLGYRCLRRFQKPNPLGFFFCPLQEKRYHEDMLAHERVYRQAQLLRFAVDTIQPLLVRAGAAPGFAADRVAGLSDNPSLRIGDKRREQSNGFISHPFQIVEIPALRGASLSQLSLRGDMRQQRVRIVSGSHFGGFFPSAGVLFRGDPPALFPFLGVLVGQCPPLQLYHNKAIMMILFVLFMTIFVNFSD
jgi:hypothetical protein